MKVKVSIQIFIKLMIIGLFIWYLPSYSLDNAQVFQAVEINQVQNTSTVLTSDKKVHIYNTHQSEAYQGYDVISGAHYLSECLNDLGYFCDVENNDFENYKAIHSIAYNKSYTVSKMYLENALSQSGAYDLVIDFHRDSLSKSLSSLSHEGKSYAKIMFVVGKSSGKYEEVLALSQDLSNRVNQYVDGLSRGIMEKKNHYNQGICDHTVLIEFGGQENTKEEVQATIEVVSRAIKDYLQ